MDQEYEDKLIERINNGTLTDMDIDEALDRGGRAKAALLARERYLSSQKKHQALMRNLHPNAFDGIDSEGKAYKDYPINDELWT